MGLPVVDEVINIVTKGIDYVIQVFHKVYDTLAEFIRYIVAYVFFLFSQFPFDNPKKTLMLSVIFFLAVVGLIIISSDTDWGKEGVNNVRPKTMELISFSSMGGSETGITTTTTLSIPPSGVSSGCATDDDCRSIGGEYLGELKCCTPETYAGYSCAGHCLRYEGLDREACKHPNACLYSGSWDEFVNDSRRCDNRYSSQTGEFSGTQYCQLRNTDQTGNIDSQVRCCTDNRLSPCYGYCLIPGQSYDCEDVTACYAQNQAEVIFLEWTEK